MLARLGAAGCAVTLLCVLGSCSGSDVDTSGSGTGGGLITGANSSSAASSGGSGPTSSSQSSSGVGGSAEGGATSSSSSGSGAGGAGGSPSCPDIGIGEPNDFESTAFALTNVDDCAAALTVSGTIAGNESDWFVYEGDDALCIVNPERTFTQPGGLRLCKFFECGNGQANTEVNCPSGTSPAISSGGRPGCCSTSGFKLSNLNGLNCAGSIDDNAFVFLQISAVSPSSTTCAAYSFKYNY